MVLQKVRALFVAFILFEHLPLQLEGRPPPIQAPPVKNMPSIGGSIGCLETVLQSSSSKKPNDQLVPMLNIALLSASVGKYFLNRKKNISTECHETAMASVQLWQRLPIVEEVDALIQGAFRDVVDDVKVIHAVKNPVAVVCQKIEKRFMNDVILSQEFLHTKERLRKQGTNKAYTKVVEMPKSNDNAKDLIAEEFEDPIIGQLLAHIAFVNQLKTDKATSQEYYKWAKATLLLAKKESLVDAVQTLYDKTRSETANRIVSPKRKHGTSNLITGVFETEMMNNLKENFNSDLSLKTDFEEAVKRIQDIN